MDRFRNVLLYVDSAQPASAAYNRALRLCGRTGARLTLLAVTPELSVYLRYPQFSYPSLEKTLEEEAERGLRKLAGRAREAGVDASTKIRHGKPHLEIAREALSGGHDLVMLAVEDDGAAGRPWSTAMRLFRVCPCAVWAVRTKDDGPPARILAAVDPSSRTVADTALNESILERAVWLAESEPARLDVVHVWNGGPDGSEGAPSVRDEIAELAGESLAALVEKYQLPAEAVQLVEGDPVAAILEYVDEHDVELLVMGTVVRTGVAGILIGNTAEKVLGKADCSVLAIKPAGFKSPVSEETGAE